MTEATTTRRSSVEVRERLTAAASDAFNETGYGAKTKDIAQRAGVAESLIYTQFGSKTELFRVAVISSFTDAIEEWAASWEGATVDGDTAAMTDSYVRAVYEMARSHRPLLRELMARSDQKDQTLATLAQEVSRRFANSLGRVQRVVRLAAVARGYPLDYSVTLAIATAMIVSTAVFEDWFLPDECKDAPPERLITEMVALCMYGVSQRPPATS